MQKITKMKDIGQEEVEVCKDYHEGSADTKAELRKTKIRKELTECERQREETGDVRTRQRIH